MKSRNAFLPVCSAILLTPILAGCFGNFGAIGDLLDDIIADSRVVTIRVSNVSDYTIEPHIYYTGDLSDFEAILVGIFGGEELAFPRLDPGEAYEIDIDCDDIGLLYAGESEQIGFFGTIAEADASDVFEYDDDFDCGDIVEFYFFGNDNAFTYDVSVNDTIIYRD